jgi:hypothetical protein
MLDFHGARAEWGFAGRDAGLVNRCEDADKTVKILGP